MNVMPKSHARMSIPKLSPCKSVPSRERPPVRSEGEDVCVCACVYVCMYVCMYVSMYVSMYSVRLREDSSSF